MRLALIGARGHTGAVLIELIQAHPHFELALASSRAHNGQRVADQVPAYRGDLRFSEASPEQAADASVDGLVLALPNGLAAPYAVAWHNAGHIGPVIDLSADHRFDSAWHYGLPELTRAAAAGQTSISNPGCYATAMQLALAPLQDLLTGTPHCFGVSGYSGAGTTPSDKNDPQKLQDNLLPYAPFDHIHEREVSVHLHRTVRFIPHVAAFFRGINMTITASVHAGTADDDIGERLHAAYTDEPLVRVSRQAPWVAHNVGHHYACVGGWATRDGQLVVYSTLDNLLKGAATQALQNLNLACGYTELEGIPCD